MKVASDLLADVVDAYVVADSAYSSAALVGELEGVVSRDVPPVAVRVLS